jgi:hypothetical protein
MAKLRGKTPTLISGSSGKPAIATAKKKRACKRCKENILLGDSLFEIPKAGGGFSRKVPFCMSCFKDILEQTKKDLNDLQETWNLNNQ